MREHKELLREWLRNKGVHISDIKYALDWYDAEILAGREPKDESVRIKAEEGHKYAVEAASMTPVKVDSGSPVMINLPEIKLKRLILGSLIGTSITLVILEGIKWVFLEIQLQLLLVG